MTGEHDRLPRLSYMLVPLMPAVSLAVGRSGMARWLPDEIAFVYWIGEWALFWAMAFAFTRAFTPYAKPLHCPRGLLIFAGGIASALTFTLLSPWYSQIFAGWITEAEVSARLVDPRGRLAMDSVVQTVIAGSAGAGLWTVATLLFEAGEHRASAPVAAEGREPEASPEPRSAAWPVPRFLARTPGVGVADVLALEAEDHYVRVHLQRGSQLIHYRFADAVAEMEPGLGLRVHRSFWVASAAVKEVLRGRRMELLLANGTRVPVSDSYRSYLPEDRAAVPGLQI